jgi:ferredoxin-NADP reductase
MPPIWYPATITRIQEVNARMRRYWVALPAELAFTFRAGQFVTMDLPIGDKRLQRWRSYSIASAPADASHELEFCIVQLPGGAATTFLFEQVQVGDSLRFKGPEGTFVLPDTIREDLVLICTGTGVAPFRSMLRELDKGVWTDRHIHLIYGSRTREDLLYLKEFQDLAARRPNFRYDAALSRLEDDPSEPWLHKGYVHAVYKEAYPTARPDRKFMLCGWTPMIDEAVATLIVHMGYDRTQVMYELYG